MQIGYYFENLDSRLKMILMISAVLMLIFILLLGGSFFLKKPKTPDAPINGNFIPKTKEDCNKYGSEEKRAECTDNFFYTTAISKKNIRDCLGIYSAERRNVCVRQMSVSLQNEKYCTAITGSKAKKKCILRVINEKKDASLCDKYFSSALYELEECKGGTQMLKIKNSDNKDDIFGCGYIKSDIYRDYCYLYSFQSKYGDNCSVMPNNLQGPCLDLLAVYKGTSYEACEMIKNDDYKKMCKLQYKELNGDYMKIAAEEDADRDEIGDLSEIYSRTDPNNPDTDHDGLKDGDEINQFNTDPNDPDTDNDGLKDGDEINKHGTDPNNPDTDGDGYFDGKEVETKNDPNSGDLDKDGLSDIDEKKFGADPNNPDTDGDGMSDLKETQSGFNPLRAGQYLSDTDGDGLMDIDEIFHGTNRFLPDTDNDGVKDGEEMNNLSNPLGPGDLDFDGDGLTDKEELKYRTNPSLSDSDSDGLNDYEEIFKYKTDPNMKDTDGDGYSDGDEVKNGYNPLGAGRLN